MPLEGVDRPEVEQGPGRESGAAARGQGRDGYGRVVSKSQDVMVNATGPTLSTTGRLSPYATLMPSGARKLTPGALPVMLGILWRRIQTREGVWTAPGGVGAGHGGQRRRDAQEGLERGLGAGPAGRDWGGFAGQGREGGVRMWQIAAYRTPRSGRAHLQAARA